MLRKIAIRNFKSHRSLEASFTPGANLIVGHNWAGKSTLLWAIAYALYGPSAVPGGAKLVVPIGTKEKPSVTLWLTVGGVEYELMRSSSTATLSVAGEMVANGAVAVTSKVQNLLGMDMQTFRQLKMAVQNEAASILTLGAAGLGQFINEVTQVDTVDRIISLAAAASAQAAAALEELPDTVSFTLLEDAEQEVRENLESLRAMELESADNLDQVKRWKEACENYLAELVDQVIKHQEEQKTREASRTRHAVLSAQVEESKNFLLNRAGEPADDIVFLRVQVSDRQAKVDRFKRAEVVKAKLPHLKKQVDDLKKWLISQRAPSQVEVTEAKLALDDAHLTWHAASIKLKAAKEANKKAICPACNRPYEQNDAAKLKEELEAATVTEREAGEAYTKAKDIETALRQKLESFSAQQWSLASYEDQLAEAEEELTGLDAPEEDCSEELKTLQEALWGAMKRIGETEEAERKLQGMLVAVTEEEAIIQALGESSPPPSEEDRALAKQAVEDSFARYVKDSDAHSELRVKVAQAEASLNELVKDRERAEQVASRREGLEERRRLLDKLVKYLRGNRDAFTARIWESLLQRCSTFVSDSTGGRITEMARTADGKFEYVEEGTRKPVEVASGIQQAVLGVGVRKALAEAMGVGGSFLLLDEVTAGARDEVSLEIARALASTEDQIVLVTHRQEDAAVADNVIQL